MLDTIPGSRRGAPAENTERFWLDSTDGPIEHLKTGCLSKHWLTPRGRDGPSGAGGHAGSRPGGAAELTDPVLAAVHPSSAGAWDLSRMGGGHADVPTLWSGRLSVSELAVRPGRTRRLRLPA
jgi:hypothetical protein